MDKPPDVIDPSVEQVWRKVLGSGDMFTQERRMRTLFRHLPRDPRCKNCNAPFRGVGSSIVKLLLNKRPSRYNPRICNICEEFAARHQGGAEIELSMLFADIRGSTTLAESMTVSEFRNLIDRFYQTCTKILIDTDAMIDKLIGDQVTGLYLPGYAGQQHARRAVEAAQDILRATGHGTPQGPWAPLGVGVHTGIAYVGAVGSKDGVVDITA
jgi:adenylate cyclase